MPFDSRALWESQALARVDHQVAALPHPAVLRPKSWSGSQSYTQGSGRCVCARMGGGGAGGGLSLQKEELYPQYLLGLRWD